MQQLQEALDAIEDPEVRKKLEEGVDELERRYLDALLDDEPCKDVVSDDEYRAIQREENRQDMLRNARQKLHDNAKLTIQPRITVRSGRNR